MTNRVLWVLPVLWFGAGCGSSMPSRYVPVEVGLVTAIESGPLTLAVLEAPEAEAELFLQPVVVEDRAFLRLWLSYKNVTHEPMLFDPMLVADLKRLGRSSAPVEALVLVPREEVLEHVTRKQRGAVLARALGGVLEAVATVLLSDATDDCEDPSFAYQVEEDSHVEAVAAIAVETLDQALAITEDFEHDKDNLKIELLRPRLLQPGEIVQGSIYFRLEQREGSIWSWKSHRAMELSHDSEHRYVATLSLGTARRTVIFTPRAH